MANNFWDQLWQKGRPVLGLSPMDGVTDAAFRYMVGKYGRKQGSELPKSSEPCGVDVMFTEFVSVDALHYATGECKKRILKTFMKANEVSTLQGDTFAFAKESPWPYEVAQVFGRTPELFAEAAELVEKLGFDGIDINMGCPAHAVAENGSGAGLIRTPGLAQEIVKTVKTSTKLPVSVKTRIGITDKSEMEEWIEALMEMNPAVISLHGRTLRQLYQDLADWEAIGEAGRIVHKRGGHILGNGDVKSVQDAKLKVHNYGVDGVLIGRAAEGNPGIFLQGSELCKVCGILSSEPCKHVRLAWAVEHAHKHEEVWGTDNFLPVRKHLAWYCHGFPGAVEMRMRLMQTNSADEVNKIVEELI